MNKRIIYFCKSDKDANKQTKKQTNTKERSEIWIIKGQTFRKSISPHDRIYPFSPFPPIHIINDRGNTCVVVFVRAGRRRSSRIVSPEIVRRSAINLVSIRFNITVLRPTDRILIFRYSLFIARGHWQIVAHQHYIVRINMKYKREEFVNVSFRNKRF